METKSTRILNQHCSRNFERRRQKSINSTVPIHRKTRRKFQPTMNATINEQMRGDLPRMVETKGVQEDDGNQRGSRDKSVLILCHGEKRRYFKRRWDFPGSEFPWICPIHRSRFYLSWGLSLKIQAGAGKKSTPSSSCWKPISSRISFC